MLTDKEKELCPRLIDYFVIVGTRSRKSPDKVQIEPGEVSHSYPEILRRYPSNNHSDFPLPAEVAVFCQPEGCSTLLSTTWPIARSTFFMFQLTEKDSAKTRYGFCYSTHQSFTPESANAEPADAHEVSLTSLCLISHHPFASFFEDVLTFLQTIICSCDFRTQKAISIKNVVWSVITGNWDEPIPMHAIKEIKEMETYVLTLLSAPVPVPGKTKLVITLMPDNLLPDYQVCLPDHTRFNLVDFPIYLPFELLGVDVALQVLTAIMLEFKVVIQSKNYNDLSLSVLAFINLLYPLEYMFPVIPLLPTFLASAEQILLAPTPFVIGVPAMFFKHKKITLPSDIVLVDLDSCQVVVPDDICIPALPEPEASTLKRVMGDALEKRYTINQAPRQPLHDPEYSLISDTTDVVFRVSMVKFFNSPNIFGDFSEHTRTLRLYPRPVVALQTDSFLRSRPVQSQFIVELCRTQAVEYFAEYCLCPSNETFVRIQAGIESERQVGDKPRWYAENLMPIRFVVHAACSNVCTLFLKGEDETMMDRKDLDDMAALATSYSLADLVSDKNESSDKINPITEVGHIYQQPLTLKLPEKDKDEVESTISSGRSTPSSAGDGSEADFARLADNMVIKSNSKGKFAFEHGDDDDIDVESTPIAKKRHGDVNGKEGSAASDSDGSVKKRGLRIKGLSTLTESGEKVLGQNFMFSMVGYAEKSQDILSQVIGKTAPKAQALKNKAIAPLTGSHNDANKNPVAKPAVNASIQTASIQNKNQIAVREICDQVLAGQGVGVFTYNKLKKLMEDESLRELACSKLNLGLDQKLQEDEFVKEIQLSRSQYKGYVRVLQACVAGLEASFKTPGCCGMASTFHILEICHTHFWSRNDFATPTSSQKFELMSPLEVASPVIPKSSSRVDGFEPKHKTSTSSDKTIVADGINKLTLQDDSHPEEAPSDSAAQGEPKKRQPPPIPPRVPPRPAPSSVAAMAASSRTHPPPRVTPPPLVPPPPKPFASSELNSSYMSVSSADSKESDCSTSSSKSSSSKSSGGQHEKLMASLVKTDLLRDPERSKTDRMNNNETRVTDKSQIVLPELANRKSSGGVNDSNKHFLYQDIVLSSPNPLWLNLVFWENVFVDIVAQEREIVGMDEEPSEMIDRYCQLSDIERKRLELDEDRLLGTLLHNLTSYMIMCGTGQQSIQMKVRRLLGKAHVGLIASQKVNRLLDDLPSEQTNAISLKPLGSRLLQKLSFVVYTAPNNEGEMLFVDVSEDAMVVRGVTGNVIERWWYERLVNMTYSPKSKLLCVWSRSDDKVNMHTFYTRKCKELYEALKNAMKRAADRGQYNIEDRALGGEFPIHDVERNEGGLIQIRSDGIVILFESKKIFIDIKDIKKCNTFGGNIFLLEEYNRDTGSVNSRRFYSNMVSSISL
ncbi:unnamed protein product [Auanema sp. JU1783]|nr:unnamed protein product [Auanema sp. JU1783]